MALNGRFPDTMLAYLGWPEMDHLRLVPAAAASITRLAAAFEAAFSKPLYLSDAYRTYAQQVSLKALKGVFAATPGTSNHGLGLAIDMASRINVDGSAEHRWMEANGPQFGWINPAWAVDFNPANGQHEPWHWEYKPALDTHPTPAQEDDMTPEQDNLLHHVSAQLVDVTNLLLGLPASVWATPVTRVPGSPTTILQDTVDGTTAALVTREIVATLPPAAAGVGISLEQVEAAVKVALGTLQLKSV